MPTPTPAIPVFKSDVLVDATALNAVGSNLTNLYNYTLGGFRTRKPFTAVRSTAGTVPAATDTKITWDTVDIDNDGMWTSGTNDHLIVQTTGVYWIQIQGAITHTPGGTNMSTYITINGTTPNTNSFGAVNIGDGNMLPAAALVGLAAGATIYGFVFCVSSTAISSANGGCRLTAEWVSP